MGLVAASLPLLADDTTWFGYMRAGAGRASSGGTMTNFILKAPTAAGGGYQGHYRLGNETDNYGEIGWDKKLYDKDGATFNVMAMVNWDPDITSNYSNKAVNMEQMYAYGKGCLGTSDAFKDAIIWAGTRFYNRLDIHMLDWKYLVNDGTGGGVENINLGFGKLAYAYLQYQNGVSFGPDATTVSGVSNVNAVHHLKLDDITINPGGKLYFAVEVHEASPFKGTVRTAAVDAHYEIDQTNGTIVLVPAVPAGTASATSNDSNNNGGLAFTAMHTQTLMGGANHFVVQYGNGSAWNLSGSDDPSKASGNKSWRFVDEISIQPTKTFGMEAAIATQHWKTADGVSATWTTIGGRPMFGLTEHFSIAAEAGWTKTTEDNLPDLTMTKGTLALQWSPTTELYSRPSIRAYVTNAQWNNNAKGIVGGANFIDKTSGTTYGVQTEIWW
jgi:maltoporin